MKTLTSTLILTFLMVLSSAAFAQKAPPTLKQGTFLFGGSIGFSKSNTDYDHTYEFGGVTSTASSEMDITTISFLPSVGWFFKDTLMLFGSFGFTKKTQKATDTNGDTSKENITENVIELGIRKYASQGTFCLYGGVSVGIRESEPFGYFDLDEKFLSVHGGALYMLSPSLGLDLGLKLSYSDGDVNSTGLKVYSVTFGYLGIQAFF